MRASQALLDARLIAHGAVLVSRWLLWSASWSLALFTGRKECDATLPFTISLAWSEGGNGHAESQTLDQAGDAPGARQAEGSALLAAALAEGVVCEQSFCFERVNRRKRSG